MGCSSSKAAVPASQSPSKQGGVTSMQSRSVDRDVISNKIRPDQPERLYKLLARAQQASNRGERYELYQKVLEHCHEQPMAAKWSNPTTGATPLHLACRLVDFVDSSQDLFQVLDTLIGANAGALRVMDASNNTPLHYAIAPTSQFDPYGDGNKKDSAPPTNWRERSRTVHCLIQADPHAAAHYLQRNDVKFDSLDATGGCSPLYRVLQCLPDDFDPSGPTVEYAAVVQGAFPLNAGRGNASDGDKPLGLLYRRFTRQFDISEQFFAGDNSRQEVVSHRQRYKTAAGNTWKLIEVLLRPPNLPATAPWGIVHRAVQVETPPDLLRYIVETNAQDLTRVDPEGNLPLHYAAASKPPTLPKESNGTKSVLAADRFPAFYTKYVVDELLYKFPEAANMADAQGRYPLTLAVDSGKQWIGGGIKSLYEAYPDALKQIDLENHPTLTRALSILEDEGEKEEYKDEKQTLIAGVVKDEHHDAIMLVQQPNVTVEEVATSMWAHEEDAGVQMLGCVAIANMTTEKSPEQVLQIALSATAAVVNAMKAHPNELIVQEKACAALKGLAVADGKREVSMVASGAVAAIVGAMQAHVGDAGVQEHGCGAIASIVQFGGADRATVVASVSGVTAILNALAAHAQVLGVQQAGIHALSSMTRHANANLPELPMSQTEPLLMAAKEAYPAECSKPVDELLQRLS
eukprot:Nitzschia sp. Nitz4//scaffold72_size95085//65549//67618//NITZ4_004765-RA/size95085-processed-gene-0.104-mRNA-1//-1//CDS//3329557390//7209//frame0